MVFEVVLENLEEAKIADKYGVKRVEVCSGLDLGGLTPSYGILESLVNNLNCEVHSMIRPRSGGFIYNASEIKLMKRDIYLSQKSGCKGVVFGVVTEKKSIDKHNAILLTEYSRSLVLEVTFHRAIDFTNNIFESIEDLITVGVTRILTSGGKNTVDEGLDNIEKIFELYKTQIQIMAGGGVNISNAKRLIEFNIDAIHFNLRKPKVHQSNTLMGIEYEIDEDKINNIIGIEK